jgi:hypothetical protein
MLMMVVGMVQMVVVVMRVRLLQHNDRVRVRGAVDACPARGAAGVGGGC